MTTSSKPRAGQALPEFGFDTVGHGRVDFSGSGGWRLLVIYRGKHCPLCVNYLDTLNGLLDQYTEAGVKVCALSADPPERARQQVEAEGWRFPVGYGLSEPDMRRLGLYVSAPRSPEETDRPFPEPAVYVLNPAGLLQIVDISNAPFARPDLAGLLGGIRFIQANDYPIRGTL